MSKRTFPSTEEGGSGKMGWGGVGSLRRDLAPESSVPAKNTLVVFSFSVLAFRDPPRGLRSLVSGQNISREEGKGSQTPAKLADSQRGWGLSFCHSTCSLDSQKDSNLHMVSLPPPHVPPPTLPSSKSL